MTSLVGRPVPPSNTVTRSPAVARGGKSPSPAHTSSTRSRDSAGLRLGGLRLSDCLVLAFFLLFYANVLVVASQRYGVPTVVSSSAVLLLMIPPVGRALQQQNRLVWTPTIWAILAYLVAMTLSAAASTHTDKTLAPLSNFVLEGLVLYLLVSNVAIDAKRWRQIISVIVVAAIAMSILAVLQELTKSYDSSFGGFAQVSAGGFDVATNNSALDQLRPRLAGPIGEQNRFAQILLVAAPMAYFGARASASRFRQVAGYAGAVAVVCGVLVTYSRGAALAAGGLLVLLMAHRFIRARHLLLMVALAGASIVFIAPDFAVRLSSLSSLTQVGDPTTNAVDGAISGRAVELQAAWNTFVEHPIVGVGPGRFFREYSQIEANKLSSVKYLDTNRRAHNLYAEILADLGILGFSAFAAANMITITLLVRARRSARSTGNKSNELLAGAVLFGLYAYLLTGMFLQLSYQRYYWALLAIANGVASAVQRESSSAQTVAQ